MDRRYIEYTSQLLLEDERFLAAEKDVVGEEKLFWDELATENKNFARELKIARIILHGIQKKSEANQLSSKDELSLWNRIEQSKYAYKKQKSRRLWIRSSVAAAASILIFFFNYYRITSRTEKEIDYISLITTSLYQEDETNREIILIISDQDKINLSGKEAFVNYRNGRIEIKSNTDNEEKVEDIKNVLNQLIVPKGKRSIVTLADGTQMWVNAGSKVVYPAKFTGDKREVYVEGEIFLAVTPDKDKPFIVKTNDMNIEVLGTQFNVSAYKEDDIHHVILVEGKVAVKLPDNSKHTMRPNQQLTRQDSSWELHTVDNLNYLAWRYGYCQYNDQTVAEIIKSLTKYYGKSITYDEKAGKLTCTGKLDLKNDLREVIETLADAASLQIDYTENTIYLFVKP